MQECDKCGIQIYNDVFDCKYCRRTLCEDCIDNYDLEICGDCIKQGWMYEISTSYKMEWK